MPTSFARCNDLVPQRRDGFVVAGSDWSGEAHAYGDSATVYACVLPSLGGAVRLVPSGDGIGVDPVEQRLGDFPTGVVPFRVTVERGRGPASVSVRQESPASVTGGYGPAIERGKDRWRFVWDDHDPRRGSG